MKADKITNSIDLLLFLNEDKEIDMNILTSEFSKNYQTLYKIIRDYIEDGFVNKEKKKKMYLGGYKYNFVLSGKGKNFLRSLSEKINSNLKKKKTFFSFGRN